MIAVDTSSLVAYLDGSTGVDVELLDEMLKAGQVVLPPVVLSEILSDPKLPKNLRHFLSQIPLMPVTDEFWVRVGDLRAKVLSKGYKSRIADAMIAQHCVDQNQKLITRDKDFRHYQRFGGLVIAV